MSAWTHRHRRPHVRSSIRHRFQRNYYIQLITVRCATVSAASVSDNAVFCFSEISAYIFPSPMDRKADFSIAADSTSHMLTFGNSHVQP